MSGCSRVGCMQRAFMDTGLCFDHQRVAPRRFTAWFAVVAVVNLAVLGFLGWAVWSLVTWVVSK